MEYVKGLVSVVIPTHNRAELVCRAIDSALSQRYSNIEVIVVSDGSTDRTDEAMKAYEEQYPNFRYISYHPGRGGNYARNTGIKNARGEYVAFLDDDDEWHRDKTEKQLEVMNEDQGIGLVCTAMNSVDDETGKSSVFIPNVKRDCSHDILVKNCIGSTTTALVKHELLDRAGLFDEALCAKQDWDLWIRLCQITQVGVVLTPCVEYHNLPKNSQISWDYRKYAEATRYLEKKYDSLRNEKLNKNEMKTARLIADLSIARKAMKGNNRAIARKYAVKAYRVKPNLRSGIYIIASLFPLKTIKKGLALVRSVRSIKARKNGIQLNHVVKK